MYNEIGVGIHIGVTILNTMCSFCWRSGLVAACSKSRGASFVQAAPMSSDNARAKSRKGAGAGGRLFPPSRHIRTFRSLQRGSGSRQPIDPWSNTSAPMKILDSGSSACIDRRQELGDSTWKFVNAAYHQVLKGHLRPVEVQPDRGHHCGSKRDERYDSTGLLSDR
jgi:hypothetical protein